MIVKTNSLIIVMSNLIMSIPMVRISLQSKANFSIFSFLKIVKIKFKMTLQLIFVWNFSKYLQNMTSCIFHFTYQNGINQSFPCSQKFTQ